jgi:glycosyltransferase involved in cell wall biosynthesis
MDELHVSVVIPVYNERETARRTIEAVHAYLQARGLTFEIIPVDDGSTDGTADELASMSLEHVRLKRHPYNIGNGAAIKSGIRMARGRFILMMDGDGQHSAEDIGLLLPLAGQYDMVVGQRTNNSDTSMHRDAANGIFNLFASWVCHRPIRDLTSGFRIVRAEVARSFIDLLPNTFSYPTTLTLAVLRSGYSMAYVPIVTRARVGRSKISLFVDGARFFSILLRIAVFFAPLKVFTPLSFFFFATGFGWWIYRSGVEGRPFPPVSILLMLSAVFIFLIGLLSEQMTYLRHERR